MKLVLDTNILVSAYTAEGKLREYWQNGLGSHRILISPEIFSQVESTLRQTAFHLTGDEIRRILLDILDRCEIVRPKSRDEGKFANENARHLCDLAQEVSADKIITNDDILQEKGKLGDTPVVSLAQFLKGEGLI